MYSEFLKQQTMLDNSDSDTSILEFFIDDDDEIVVDAVMESVVPLRERRIHGGSEPGKSPNVERDFLSVINVFTMITFVNGLFSVMRHSKGDFVFPNSCLILSLKR